MYTIYITTNLINNKKYLGRANMLGIDFKYYLGSGLAITKAIKKYGKINFKRELIDYALTHNGIKTKEEFYLNKYNCKKLKQWYNLTNSSCGTEVGTKFTNKHKLNLSNSHKGYKMPQLQKNKIGNAHKQPIIIDNIKYNSAKDCSKMINIPYGTILRWIRKPNTRRNKRCH